MRLVLVLVLVLAGCRDKKNGSPPPPVVTAEPVKSGPTFDAAAVTSLLQLPARVAVSSLVDNPKANPNDLIDGTTKTAWNGKTGDLHAWIAARVPAGDRVTALKIAVGFDAKDASGGDLFTMNHRVTKIAISRDGQPVREVALDPSQRGLQTVPLDGPGGDYKIEIAETLPGSKPDWKEIVIGDFDVVGIPSSAREKVLKTTYPRRAAVRVGSLVAPEHYLEFETAGLRNPGPWPTLEAYCARYEKVIAEEAKDASQSVDDYLRDPREPVCASKPRTATAAEVRVHGRVTTVTYVALKTSRGWFPQAYELRRDQVVTGFMNPEITLEALKLEHPASAEPFLSLVVYQREWGPQFNPELDGGQVLLASTKRWATPIAFVDAYPQVGDALTLNEWHGEYKDMKDEPPGTFVVEADGGLSRSRTSAAADSTR
jgi:hypothetical protein